MLPLLSAGERTVAFIISMVACARNGVEYVASIFLGGAAIGRDGVAPFLRSPLLSVAVSPSRRCCRIVALETAPFLASSQVIGERLKGRFGRCHQCRDDRNGGLADLHDFFSRPASWRPSRRRS